MRKILLLLLLTALPGMAAVNVSVSQPANNATVTSPVTFKAAATTDSTAHVTGWAIYANGVKVFGTPGPTSSIAPSITLAVGTYKVTVRAWNSAGVSGSAYLTIVVATTPPPPAPVPTVGPLGTLASSAANIPANILVPLSGLGAMIAGDLPPKANGAQDVAVTSAINSLLNRGMLPAPTSTYPLTDYNAFALMYARKNNLYSDLRPKTTIIAYIQMFLKQDLNTDGTVNWSNCTATVKCVDQDLTDLVNLALDPTLGNFTISGTVTNAQIIAFVNDLAHIVDTYNRS